MRCLSALGFYSLLLLFLFVFLLFAFLRELLLPGDVGTACTLSPRGTKPVHERMRLAGPTHLSP